MKRQSGLIVLILIAVAGASAWAVLRKHPVDEAALRASLIGKWRALDPDNSALHRRREGAAAEDAEFKSDGTLLYHVTAKSAKKEIQTDVYGWEISGGKLQLRYKGEGSTNDVLTRFRIAVKDKKMTMYKRKSPDKVFQRVD